ncbi:epiphycan [Notechis scutatus]|uniref:Epiphycan n=1 Tax=Notechis scutatus TaxID=8663 RepID=A0A6J1VZQ9_9SAUR|nr:epiphycan [Notechis scutatus]
MKAFAGILMGYFIFDSIMAAPTMSSVTDVSETYEFEDLENLHDHDEELYIDQEQDMIDLYHLYITSNNLDHIPVPLPESLQSLRLQNCEFFIAVKQ